MQLRTMILAIAAAGVAGGACAEPPNGRVAPDPRNPRAEVVLASAESTALPQAEQARERAAPAKRKIAARVTSCRCGDPQVDPEQQEQ